MRYIGTPRKIEGYVLSEFDTHGHQLLAESRRLVAAVYSRFSERLRTGELVAWAREGSPLAPWREIPSTAWASLDVDDADAGTVKGPGGVALYDVHVGRRVVPPEPLIEAGTPGRPSAAHLVVAEFDRRVGAGLLCETLKAEAETLAAWLKRSHPKAPPLGASRIQEVIRGGYNAWKADRARRGQDG